jgi:hypothetical protein
LIEKEKEYQVNKILYKNGNPAGLPKKLGIIVSAPKTIKFY